MLVPLHVKSHYSLGFGTASVAALAERAAKLGLPALALTDIENIYGQVAFHRLAREAGLRPITGVELKPSPRSRKKGGDLPHAGRLLLLARDRAGYRSICRVVTRRKLGVPLEKLRDLPEPPEPGEPPDPVESLGEDLECLFVLTDDPSTLERLLRLPSLDHDCARLLLVPPGRTDTGERRVS